ncbi:MAG: pentapeptide repeat-containing protein, partial [Pseudorhodobacter sp.]|nr:pentapeptide repeat-containing protein [Frankiaceae bacterium]
MRSTAPTSDGSRCSTWGGPCPGRLHRHRPAHPVPGRRRGAHRRLRCPDLSSADLTGADLTGADLTGADLTGVDLSSADFDSACVGPRAEP